MPAKSKSKSPKKKFTTLQERFIDQMIACGIGAKAARLSGIATGNAANQATRWMCNDEIRAAVEAGRRELQHNVQFDAAAVLRELAVLATTDMSAFITEDGFLRTNLKDLPPEAVACISEITDEEHLGIHRYKVKLHDRIKAIQLAGKHKAVRAFTEDISVTDTLSERLAKLLRERAEHESDSAMV